MKPIIYMIAGAMIPICVMEMAKTKCFTKVLSKVEKVCKDMENKSASQGSNSNQNS